MILNLVMVMEFMTLDECKSKNRCERFPFNLLLGNKILRDDFMRYSNIKRMKCEQKNDSGNTIKDPESIIYTSDIYSIKDLCRFGTN